MAALGLCCCAQASLVAQHKALGVWVSIAAARRLSSCGEWAYLLYSIWHTPGRGSEPVSPARAGGFLCIAMPGKSLDEFWPIIMTSQMLTSQWNGSQWMGPAVDADSEKLLQAVASDWAPGGHTSFYLFPSKLERRNKHHRISEPVLYVSVYTEVQKLITWCTFPRLLQYQQRRRMFRMILILFTLNSQVV